MARKMLPNGRNKTQSFIMVRHDIFDSLAWKSIKPVARCVWLEVARRYNGNNNGSIPLSCLEAGRYIGVSKNTANTAFKQLIEAGFIKVAIPSGFNNKMRRSTRWTLTHERMGNNAASNEWRKRSTELAKLKHGTVSIPPQSHDRDTGFNTKDYSPT